MKFLRISIFTTLERNDAIDAVRQAIGGCGGWIVDHALFSNLLATVNFEIPIDKAETLLSALQDAGFKPEIDGETPRGESGDLRGQISLSFIHQEADMRRDVPPFG